MDSQGFVHGAIALTPEMLARDAEREAQYRADEVLRRDTERRATALSLAISAMGAKADDEIVTTARAFDDFLKGDQPTASQH
jgi:hypothetical protein